MMLCLLLLRELKLNTLKFFVDFSVKDHDRDLGFNTQPNLARIEKAQSKQKILRSTSH